jgi:CRISPR-associated protein Cas6
MVSATETVIDLLFSIRGSAIPADHGYALFSALCRVLPWLHDEEAIGVHTISGQLVGNRQLRLTDRSYLTLRLPASRLSEALPLAGQRLDVEGGTIAVGVPKVRALRPAATLASRLVVIKGFTEPVDFLDAARRQLREIDSGAEVSFIARRAEHSLERATVREAGTPLRRTLRIRDKEIVGFALAVQRLSAEGSLELQSVGLGGRRHFGCGIFLPVLR